jgi:hypothetical protein
MASIEIAPDSLIVHVEGADKLWALKSRLEMPFAHVVSVDLASKKTKAWHGFRLPATHIPGVIAAGTFREDGETVFWDVHHPDRAVEIALRDERYSRLVIEIEDPAAAVASIESAMTGAVAGL